jgi:hypothetical protein
MAAGGAILRGEPDNQAGNGDSGRAYFRARMDDSG